MIIGKAYFNNDVFYLRKKHFCPDCQTQLETVKVSRIVNSNSPEAKDFDFSGGDGFLVGDVKFTWKEFECPKCNRHLTVSEMKRLEGIHIPDAKKTKIISTIIFIIFAILFFAFFALKHFCIKTMKKR